MQGPIKTTTPTRRAGQTSVVGLRTEPLETVRIGIVGLGERGLKAVERLREVSHARIVALCDTSREHVDAALRLLADRQTAATFTGEQSYTELCQAADVDLVYICTDWASHTRIAIEGMNHGKHVAIEVPAATTIAECWALVDTAERTRRHCTMLENCCYDYFELSLKERARKGAFGEIIHVEGGYGHPLGDQWTRWRLDINRQLRGDLYPTHGFGPLCQLLGIHRSDQLDVLVSMDTAAFSGPTVYQQHTGQAAPDFQNGDQTSTLIRTRRGKTILLQHNVMTPRPYTRMLKVVGTEGFAEEPANPIADDLPDWVAPLREKAARLDPRGGMAYLMDWQIVNSLHRGLPLDIDVYDVAEWCAVSELSRLSIENGSMPVAYPNFLR